MNIIYVISDFGFSAVDLWSKWDDYVIRIFVQIKYVMFTRTAARGGQGRNLLEWKSWKDDLQYYIFVGEGRDFRLPTSLTSRKSPTSIPEFLLYSRHSHTTLGRVTRSDTWRTWEKRLVVILTRRWIYSIFKLPFGCSNVIRATRRWVFGDYVQCN